MTAASRGECRGGAGSRLRFGLLRGLSAVATRLPAGVAAAAADAIGELWYRLTPGRAARARRNLERVAGALAERGTGSPRARAAATDRQALERMVRSAYRHAVRTYLELLRAPAVQRDWKRLLDIENPADVDAALAVAPAVWATLHFGSMEVISHVMTDRSPTPVTAPMESLRDPGVQAFMETARAAGGARLVPLEAARRELRGALARGENIGIVADRDVAGGGLPAMLFGHPAPLPVGPALLAIEAGVPVHVAAARRVGGRYRGRLITLPPPVPGPRRARVEALLAAEARAFEDLIGDAPEQWWSVFFPIWPDLELAEKPTVGATPTGAESGAAEAAPDAAKVAAGPAEAPAP